MLKITKERSISVECEALLNEQAKKEAEASQIYLAMASWCDKKFFRGSMKYLYAHAEEERAHFLKIIHYINDAGGNAVVPSVEQPSTEYKNLEDLFAKVLEHEVMISNSVNEKYKSALLEGDFATVEFLQWFVKEQVEEVDKSRIIMSFFDQINPSTESCLEIHTIDKAIGDL
jgi:ferritin